MDNIELTENNQSVQNPTGKGMKTCKACGASIAKNAKACPNCGAKNKKPIYKRFWFILLVVIIIGSIIAAANKKSYDFEKPDFTVTVDTIIQDYKDNSSTAAEKYSDKVIAVTGKVANVSESFVRLDAYDDDLWLESVYCYLSDTSELAKLKNGTTATFVGVGDNTDLFGDIKIEQCKINDKFAIKVDYDNPLAVDAKTIVKAYQDNQVAADKSYKYKPVKLEGTVTNVADGYAVVEPVGTDAWDFDSDIQVYFENDADLSKIAEDARITIIGECYGQADFYKIKLCRAIIK